jgi:hypothetical protein
MTKNKIIVGIGLVASLAGTAYMNRFRYFKIGGGEGVERPLRTNVFSNETDMLTANGWKVVQSPRDWKWEHFIKTAPLPAPVPLAQADPFRQFGGEVLPPPKPVPMN